MPKCFDPIVNTLAGGPEHPGNLYDGAPLPDLQERQRSAIDIGISHEYVKTGIDWLETMNDAGVRAATITCLATFLERRHEHRDEILRALWHTLERDEDPIVQEDCYRVLLKQVMPEEAANIPHPTVRFFDRATDVRWDLLAPLRERYGKR